MEIPPLPPEPVLDYAQPDLYRPWVDRLIWACAGILAYLAINGLSAIASLCAMVAGTFAGLDSSILGVMAGACHLLTFTLCGLLLAFWCVWVSRHLDRQSPALVIIALVLAVLATLFGACANWLTPMIVMRFISSVQGYSRIAVARGYVSLAWTALLPILLMILIFWLRARRPR